MPRATRDEVADWMTMSPAVTLTRDHSCMAAMHLIYKQSQLSPLRNICLSSTHATCSRYQNDGARHRKMRTLKTFFKVYVMAKKDSVRLCDTGILPYVVDLPEIQ